MQLSTLPHILFLQKFIEQFVVSKWAKLFQAYIAVEPKSTPDNWKLELRYSDISHKHCSLNSALDRCRARNERKLMIVDADGRSYFREKNWKYETRIENPMELRDQRKEKGLEFLRGNAVQFVPGNTWKNEKKIRIAYGVILHSGLSKDSNGCHQPDRGILGSLLI